jgi:hypothetical protein
LNLRFGEKETNSKNCEIFIDFKPAQHYARMNESAIPLPPDVSFDYHSLLEHGSFSGPRIGRRHGFDACHGSKAD